MWKKRNAFSTRFSAIVYITSKLWIQKLNSYFADFKQVKKMLVIFLTLNKSKMLVIFLTLGKWSFYWLWINSHFADLSVILLTLNNTVRPPLVTYPSLCSTCATYGTLCHAIGHQLLPTQPCYRKRYRFERAFFALRRFSP